MNIITAGKTDMGKIRKNNEDSIFMSEKPLGIFPNAFIVADGMGGHSAGEVASGKAVDFFRRYGEQPEAREGSSKEELLDSLIASVSYANEMTYLASVEDESLYGMGTTFTACVIQENKAYIAHVGDSRIYCLRSGMLRQLTNDHTYVNELVRAGQLTHEAARQHPKRNMLTRALGIEPILLVDGYTEALSPGDRLLLCSDGLTTMLSDEEILGLLKEDAPADRRVDRLIDEANAKGGLDNISVILIDIC